MAIVQTSLLSECVKAHLEEVECHNACKARSQERDHALDGGPVRIARPAGHLLLEKVTGCVERAMSGPARRALDGPAVAPVAVALASALGQLRERAPHEAVARHTRIVVACWAESSGA